MLRIVVTVCMVVLSAACAQLPRAEFQAYRESVKAAQTAAEPMIADYAVAERAELLERMRTDSERAYDDYFPGFRISDSDALSTIDMPPGAGAVERAFRGIAAYNDTLAALAENRNIDEARGQLGQIIGDIGGIVPGSEAGQAVARGVSDLVLTVLSPAIAADNRAEFKRILLEGKPKVAALIAVLRAHTPTQYSTTTRLLSRRADQDPPPPDRAEVINRINAWHRAFADYVALLGIMEQRLDDLAQAVENPKSAPLLARAAAGAAQLRAYADALRLSLAQLRATI